MKTLEGMRVLDVSIAMSGPFAAQKLADLGADVVKVEPLAGEWQRHAAAGGARGNQVNASFLSLNRNKRSIALDLKNDSAREVIHKLVETADVFLQNYRTGVAERLGVDYETLRKINPRLIYVSMSGYGGSGPYATKPGQDVILQAMSGALYSAGREGEAPRPAPFFLVDAFAAYSAFEGTLAAIIHRLRTGEGQLVEVNMLDAIIAAQMQEISVHTVGGIPQMPAEEIHAHSYIRAPYGVFPTSDGYIALSFADAPLLASVLDDDRFLQYDVERDGFEKKDEISRLVTEGLAKNSTEHWLTALGDAGAWVGPVYDYDGLMQDPQVAHNNSFVEYEHPTEGRVKTPGFNFRLSASTQEVTRPAPLAGQHSEELLAELGLDAAQIAELVAAGAVHQSTVLQPASA
ncbi:Crotonobetainyl-CoA:carnitine CoA-transferase CaiB [Paramicrobacterium humi]|uniref:Crotonobetainyl-CoA:carnitine CoA-transferase CaiB n=1 Tax=Paramicrobacterium humi TaxID=640635 RepID=A0A1H4KAY6_9MICO|nr:CoA transferase [Microbacterium humi]SEB55198.1 Crotonobetainyl-CoA:carnitine CoA-transferase CaiB [Microbacterium humi]